MRDYLMAATAMECIVARMTDKSAEIRADFSVSEMATLEPGRGRTLVVGPSTGKVHEWIRFVYAQSMSYHQNERRSSSAISAWTCTPQMLSHWVLTQMEKCSALW
jgi:hypothetical protein